MTTADSDPQEPHGHQGWLLYFILGQIATVALLGYDIASVWALPSTVAARLSADSFEALRITQSIDAAVILYVVGGLCAMRYRWARTPDYYVIGLPTSGTALMFSSVMAHIAFPQTGPPSSDENAAMLRPLFVSFVWFVYWLRSKRVRNTYGSNGQIRAWLNRVWLDDARPKPDAA